MRNRIATVMVLALLPALATAQDTPAQDPPLPCGDVRWILVDVVHQWFGTYDEPKEYSDELLETFNGRQLIDTCKIIEVRETTYQGKQATLIAVSAPSVAYYVKVVTNQIESVCVVMDCQEAPEVVPAAR